MAGTRNPAVQKKDSAWRRNSGELDIYDQKHLSEISVEVRCNHN